MIILSKIRWKNFLSYGNNFTELDMTKYDTTLITGANGSGKSTFLDAVTFVLFGKSFRGVKINQLVNSINEKGCLIEIEFSIGKDDYKVSRGLKPKDFEIYKNDVLIPQEAKAKDYQKMLEDQILKMSYKAFCQVVILGSSNYIPFMQLSAADRRSVVEDLLDINVFSVMNILLKGRLQSVKERITSYNNKMEVLKDKIETKKQYIEKVKQKSSDDIDNIKSEIKETEEHIENIETELEQLQNYIDDKLETLQDKDEVSSNLLKAESIEKQLKTKIREIDSNIRFYEENDTCPSCKQDIDELHKEKVFKEKEDKKKEIVESIDSIASTITKTEDNLTKLNEMLEDVREKEREVSTNQSQVTSSVKYIQRLKENIESISSESNELDKENNELQQMIGEGVQLTEDRKEQIEDAHYYEIASVLLKDSGIKSKIIKQYLPAMNKLINHYMKEMDFFCQFDLDENFDETIKSRHRDEFTYHSFSEGERLRIDLSLLLAWREVARLKNSVNCNLLILDEVFDSSLDTVGTEEFLNILKGMGNKANIFVISHKQGMTDKFDNHIEFEKKNNFSRMNRK